MSFRGALTYKCDEHILDNDKAQTNAGRGPQRLGSARFFVKAVYKTSTNSGYKYDYCHMIKSLASEGITPDGKKFS
jgi:hypothetical protein